MFSKCFQNVSQTSCEHTVGTNVFLTFSKHFQHVLHTCATYFPHFSKRCFRCLYVENSKGKNRRGCTQEKVSWGETKEFETRMEESRSNLDDENLTLSHERYGVLQALGLRSTCHASSALFLPSKPKPTSEPANKMILLETMANAFRACIVSERPNIHTHAHTHTHTHTQTRKKNILGGST